MSTQVRFGIISDPHITLPHTLWQNPGRFHLVEWSISVFEAAIQHLLELGIDFLLLPGDLTQHGEPDNHRWLADRLSQLPVPSYVIPGNHDVPTPESLGNFAEFYAGYGYTPQQTQLCYVTPIGAGIKLVGLNSNDFNDYGEQIGFLTTDQLDWLKATLQKYNQDLILVTIHHNIVEHLPGQESSALGSRYMLSNAESLRTILHDGGVKVVFTGHLHVQDIAYHDRYGIYDITTGSTVSFPHPYRHLSYTYDQDPRLGTLEISSFRVKSIPECSDLQHFSREWMGDRAGGFLLKLLTHPPLSLPVTVSEALLPQLRYFWADIAGGDAQFSFPEFPTEVKNYFESFSDRLPTDNEYTLKLNPTFLA